MDKEMLKYAVINTLTVILFIGTSIGVIGLCVNFMWLLIPFTIIGLFIGFYINYNDKMNEDEEE